MRLNISRKYWAGACLLAALVCSMAPSSQLMAQAQVTEKDVLPILEKNCLQCHGEALQMGNLDMRSLEVMLKGGDKGPALVAGNAVESLLYQRVTGVAEPKMPMAPLPALSAADIAVLKNWIDQGAHWGEATATQAAAIPSSKPTAGYGDYVERVITDQDRNYWAFKKPVRHSPPTVSDARWSSNPIDGFIKASLDAKGLIPAPEADRRTLVRRLYLDVIGLLPTPAEVNAFVNDPSPRAYEALVEKLLASPQYGERWARHWLDVVRFAESSGFEHDRTLSSVWRFRDYVIKAFNEDKPYNQLIVEHLAGDELDQPTQDSLIATSFYRFGPRVRFREKDNPYYRYDYLDDMVRTTFGGFMGVSVHCARCHDHKFDPITRKDYYKTIAMFFGYVRYDHPLVSKEEADEWARKTNEIVGALAPLQAQLSALEAPYVKAQFEARLDRLPPEVQTVIRIPREERTPGQALLAAQFERGSNDDGNDERPSGAMGEEATLGILTRAATDDSSYAYRPNAGGGRRNRGGESERIKVSDEDEAKRAPLLVQIAELEKQMPKPPVAVEGIRDGDYRLAPMGPGDAPAPGKTYKPDYDDLNPTFLPRPGVPYAVPQVHFGANGLVVEDDNKGPVVEPGFVTVLAKGTERVTNPPAREDYITSGRRRALAEWIVSDDNPLTARVLVNRLWYWNFGKGIVATPGNFGKMGVPPSHPELLDWLATEFVRQGWSIKQMQRLILNSQTYKMASSFYNSENVEKDPTNVFMWRFPSRRVEGEILRDIVLSASGKLNLKAGGEPFFPAIPIRVREGYRQGRWDMTEEGPDTWRRSIYSYWKRGMKFPMFDVHDQPDQNITAEKRNVSTVPTQALTLLNNEFTLQQAGYLADRVASEAGAVPEAQVKTLYQIALSRDPSQNELSSSLEFLAKEREFQSTEAGSAAGEGVERSPELSALTRLAHAMLNFNEFVFIH
jgi:hypothetical protein